MRPLLAGLAAIMMALVPAKAGADQYNFPGYTIWATPSERHVSYVRNGGPLVLDAWGTAEGRQLYWGDSFFYVCPLPWLGSQVYVIRTVYDGGGRFQVDYLADENNHYLGSVYTDNAFIGGRIIAFADGTLCVRWNVV